MTFSPDCKYIAVADWNNNKLKIYDINGNLVLEKEYNMEVVSVAWWMDRIAIGLGDGRIYVYKVEEYTSITTNARVLTSTVTRTTTATKLITITITTTVTKTIPCTPITITQAMTVANEGITNISSPLISPFEQLTKIYNKVSQSSGYKATLLKGPFQSNIAYLPTMAQLNDMYRRFITFENDLKESIDEFKLLLVKEPNFQALQNDGFGTEGKGESGHDE